MSGCCKQPEIKKVKRKPSLEDCTQPKKEEKEKKDIECCAEYQK